MTKLIKLALLMAAAILTTVASAQAQQELRVGLQDAEPGVIRSNGQLGGQNVEVWNAVAKDTGIHVTIVVMPNGPALLAAMDQGKLDAVGGVSKTPETEAKYLLTDQINTTAEALVVPKADTRAYRGLDDIKGLQFATLKASTYADYLRQNGITGFKEFNTTPEVLQAVAAGEANAALFSGTIAGYLLKQGKFPELKVVSSYQPALSRPTFAAFSKSASEYFGRANASLKKLIADGTYAKIRAKYGQ